MAARYDRALMREQAYRTYRYILSELPHHYGPHVHLLADAVLITQLARLSRPETIQPDITHLVRDLYESLVRAVIANELPLALTEVRTRMYASTPEAVWSGSVIDPSTNVITVGIARAGTLPSQVAFEALTRLLDPDAVRQDHLYMNRVTDASGSVTGVKLAGSKIGGGLERAVVLFPDPMGATGSSISEAVSIFKQLEGGPPRKLIAIHLIVTPEYLRRVSSEHPELRVYAIRLDRGLSAPDILKTALGERWPEERGLNERQYIVPGAGGLGEILNNSYA
jgi:uracil phosphoribosyltransferase